MPSIVPGDTGLSWGLWQLQRSLDGLFELALVTCSINGRRWSRTTSRKAPSRFQRGAGPLRRHLPSGERGARSPNRKVPPGFEPGPAPTADSLSRDGWQRSRTASLSLQPVSNRCPSRLGIAIQERKVEGSNLRPDGPTRVQAGGRATRDDAFQAKNTTGRSRDRPGHCVRGGNDSTRANACRSPDRMTRNYARVGQERSLEVRA